MVEAVRVVTGNASFHPLSNTGQPLSPQPPPLASESAPRRSGRARNPVSPYWKGGGRPNRPLGWTLLLGCRHISQSRCGPPFQELPSIVRNHINCSRPQWQVCCCAMQPQRQPDLIGISLRSKKDVRFAL
ncbi:hypothetical protein ABBQ32_007979 [Trebouxia sp. C0010 RCD-2024]